MPRKAAGSTEPEPDKDAEGNRLFAPGSLTKRKYSLLSAREREIYRESLSPDEERKHETFQELHQQSLQSLRKRSAEYIRVQTEKVSVEEARKRAEQKLQRDLEKKARETKEKLDRAAVHRNWVTENLHRNYQGLSPLPEPSYSVRSGPAVPGESAVVLTDFPRRLDENNGNASGIVSAQKPTPTTVVLSEEHRPAKKRRVYKESEEARARGILRDATKRMKEREAMTAALPDVPAWVEERLGQQMKKLNSVAAHSSRIAQSQADARAHRLEKGSPEVSAGPTETIPSNRNATPSGINTTKQNEKSQAWPFPVSDVLFQHNPNAALGPMSLRVPSSAEGSNQNSSQSQVAQPQCLMYAQRNRRVRSSPNVKPKDLTYSLLIHEFVETPAGPKIRSASRLHTKLLSKMRLETFRRRVFDKATGDPTGDNWCSVFVAYLKSNSVRTCSYWHFVNSNEEYIEYLRHVADEGTDEPHHVVIGDRMHAHLLPPWPPAHTSPQATNIYTKDSQPSADVVSNFTEMTAPQPLACVVTGQNTLSVQDQTNSSAEDQTSSGTNQGNIDSENLNLSQIYGSIIGAELSFIEDYSIVDPELRPVTLQPESTFRPHPNHTEPTLTQWGLDGQSSGNNGWDSGNGADAEFRSSITLGPFELVQGDDTALAASHPTGSYAVEASTHNPIIVGGYEVAEPPFLASLGDYDYGIMPSDIAALNSANDAFSLEREVRITDSDFYNFLEGDEAALPAEEFNNFLT